LRVRVGRGARIIFCVCVQAATEHPALREVPGSGRGTGVQGVLEYLVIPAIHEVAVQREAGRVSGRQNEAAVVVGELLRVVPQLSEEGDETDRVRGRALAVVDAIGVRHMRLVVRRVEVLAVPAGRVDTLCPEVIFTVGVDNTWGRRFIRQIVVEADRGIPRVSEVEVHGKEILTTAK
jgi:hypothetical protein